jgi:Holliday junction DNA helicase RuvA
MYAYLKGILAEKSPDLVVIDCHGVGYEVKIPLSTFELLPPPSETVLLYIYTYHNEDGTKLFGFFHKNEKELFRLLININKIGPKTALALLSYISIKELINAIVTQNYTIITKAPGFGKKTAERLCMELKDKIDDITELDTKVPHPSTDIDTRHSDTAVSTDMWHDIESAMTALGFRSNEIRHTLQNVKISENMSTQEALKVCIQYSYMKRNEA